MDKEKKNLLVFGYGLALILSALAAFTYVRHGWVLKNTIFVVLAISILLITGFNKPLLKIIYTYWMRVAHVMSACVTAIIMTIIFYGLFTPIGLFFRMIKKDYLDQRIDPGRTSYWNAREPGVFDAQRYRQQF